MWFYQSLIKQIYYHTTSIGIVSTNTDLLIERVVWRLGASDIAHTTTETNSWAYHF